MEGVKLHEEVFQTLVWKNQADFILWRMENEEMAERFFHPEDEGSDESEYSFRPLFEWHDDEDERVIVGIQVWTEEGPDAVVIGLWLMGYTEGLELHAVWGECDTLTGEFFRDGWYDFSNMEHYAKFHKEYWETAES